MVLEKGMKGALIVELQKKLGEKGIVIKADGVFGPGTMEAVRHFQRMNRLVDDGVVGMKTATLLGLTLQEPPAVAGQAPVSTSTKFAKLRGVHPRVIQVVERAAEITAMPFIINEGLRTLERQRRLVKSGASQTLNSKHLVQKDGYGHAVDLVPFADFDGNGTHEISWHWEHFYPIAEAMRKAAKELDVRIRWGGCWACLNDSVKPTRDMVADYVAFRRKMGKRAFTDGPHFELVA